MTTLNISIDIPHLTGIDFPITTEILNEKLERFQTLVVARQARVENLTPGIYLVRAMLPSGEISTVPVQIKNDDVEVNALLRISASPHEWLAQQQLFGGYRKPSQVSTLSLEQLNISNSSQKAWLRIWAFNSSDSYADQQIFPYTEKSNWHLENLSNWSYYQHLDDGKTPDVTAISLSAPIGLEPRYRVLQIGGEKLPWRMIVLPPIAWIGGLDRVQVLFRPSRSGMRLDAGVAIKLVTDNLETESLSHSIDRGDYYYSENMASSVLNTAEKLLQEKFANPYGALVGGYYLLGAGDLRRLHSWPNNFAEGFEWLPDSAIIHAWQILLDSDIQDKSIARTRLLEATQRGLPIFKQGLRYLMDGLRNFSNQARKELHKDHDVEKAFSYWQKIARAVNWNQRFVTFYGRSPYNPSFKPVTGIPKDTSEKERLLSMTLPISFKKS